MSEYPPPAHVNQGQMAVPFANPPPPQPVMIVNTQPAQAPVQNTVVVNSTTRVVKPGINHCLHCCITIFFPPWLLVWFCLCICG